MQGSEPTSFRPGFGRWLTVTFGVVCAVAALAGLATEGIDAMVMMWPWLALVAGACWLMFWQPVVSVDDQGVALVNVWHTIEVPWGALIGIETKWALTLVTVENRYRAWAAPAPGRSVLRHDYPNTHGIRQAAIGGEIRPGDLPETDSGAAATMVRRHWSAVLESGALDAVDPGAVAASRTIHWRAVVIAAVLVALAVAGIDR